MKHLKKINKKMICFAGIMIITVLFNVIAWNSTVFCDFYIANIFPIWLNTYGRLTGLFPFSVGEWLLVFGIFLLSFAVIGWVFLFSHRVRRYVKRFYAVFAWIVLIVSVVMSLNCFVLYHGSYSFANKTKELEGNYSIEELLTVRNYVVRKCNELSERMDREEDGTIRNVAHEVLAQNAITAMQQIGEKYPRLSGYYTMPKPLFFSDFFTQQYIQGYFFPFSMEANINQVMYVTNKPATMCHELSHIKGYIYEDEASLISYIACTQSEDLLFQYSGYQSVLGYLERDVQKLYQSNTEAFFAAAAKQPIVQILPQVYEDGIFLTEEEWDRINKKAIIDTETVDAVSDVLMDTSLKLNGVKDGMISYSRVVTQLLWYYAEKNFSFGT